jgi:hypothetical protein
VNAFVGKLLKSLLFGLCLGLLCGCSPALLMLEPIFVEVFPILVGVVFRELTCTATVRFSVVITILGWGLT